MMRTLRTIIAIGRNLPFCAYRPKPAWVRRAFQAPQHRVVVRLVLQGVPLALGHLLVVPDGTRVVLDCRAVVPKGHPAPVVLDPSDGAMVEVLGWVPCPGSELQIGLRTEAMPLLPPLDTRPSGDCNAAGVASPADSPGRGREPPTDPEVGNARAKP